MSDSDAKVLREAITLLSRWQGDWLNRNLASLDVDPLWKATGEFLALYGVFVEYDCKSGKVERKGWPPKAYTSQPPGGES